MIPRFTRFARRSLLSAARWAGAFRLVRDSFWRRRRLLVLCYHGVATADEHKWSSLYVTQKHLRRRLSWLRKERYSILPLAEALELQEYGELPPRAVSVTFDDGAADFYQLAYPVLQELEVPAMLYQTTWYVDRQQPVFNTASSYLLWRARARSVSLPWRAEEVVIPASMEDVGFGVLHGEARSLVLDQRMGADAQLGLLKEMAVACGVDLDELLERRQLFLMSGEELRALDSELIDIQLHTHRHRTPEDEKTFVKELRDNAAALERILRGPRDFAHFCYPSGIFRRRFGSWLHAEGIRSATTCDPGLTAPATNRMFVPRLIDTMLTPDVIFEGMASGLAAMPGGHLGRKSQRLISRINDVNWSSSELG